MTDIEFDARTERLEVEQAKAVGRPDLVPVLECRQIDGQWWIRVGLDEASWACVKKLPKALEYQGRIYGWTGWDSDRGQAYFRSPAPVARPR